MTLAELKPYVVERIKSVPELAAFGDPINYTLFQSDDEVRGQIETALAEKGVAFEVGVVSSDAAAPGASRSGVIKATVDFSVFVAENMKTEHAPTDLDLVRTIIGAVTTPASDFVEQIDWVSYDPAHSEKGYVLHTISFRTAIRL